MDTDILLDNLSTYFGLNEFREYQEEIVGYMLNGDNVCAVLPTGHGKSLCYQLPAVIDDGMTVVVSPLIALMQDQVANLKNHGIPVACLDSMQSKTEYDKNMKLAGSGEAKLLYLSPERLRTGRLYDELSGVNISRLVADEAHCISMWGHDFRPSYLKLPEARHNLGDPPIAAFTATAPVCVRDDIIKNLHAPDIKIINSDVERKNLIFDRKVFHNYWEKDEAFFDMLDNVIQRNEPTLVYFSKIRSLERISDHAKDKGYQHMVYHGKMEGDDRKKAHERFMDDDPGVMFATKAFGMGVDKPNIRNVIHFEIPEALEEYYQEAGRAGRDGKRAHCVLFYKWSDSKMSFDFVEGANPSQDFIQKRYSELWNRLPHTEKEKDFPEMFFMRSKYMENFASMGSVIAGKAMSSISAMQEYGMISTFGNKLVFLMKPIDIYGKKFPIREETIDGKRIYDEQRAKIMLHYATAKEKPKSVILRHFRDNTVIQDIDDMDRSDFVDFNPENTNKILLALTQKDHSYFYLPKMMSSEKIKSNNPMKGTIGNVTSDEIAVGIDRAASQGYIRKFSKGNNTCISLTDSGIEKLEEDNIACVIPCLSYKSLVGRMHSPYEKRTLKRSFNDWYKDEADWFTRESSWRSIESFMVKKFQILDKKVRGQKVVSDFWGISEKKVRLSDGRDMINYLFDETLRC